MTRSEERYTAMLIGLLSVLSVASCDQDASAAAATPVIAPPVAQASAADTAAHDSVDRFVGTYRFAGGEAQTKARDEAIDDVVSEMNVLFREIARKRLTSTNPIPAKLEVSREGELITIAFDGRAHRGSIDGTTTKTTGITGQELDYRVVVDGAKVRQVFRGPSGGRSNTFALPAENRVRVRVTVTSPKLPKSLEYILTFARRS